ncbi:putative acyl-CoA dehydrogenase family protein [Janibacter sp. HTCC2649]|uniref:acyl-CoA dehydrogenase family protein n=1 Tax=Janibacter sp. HTCC2649 TaxID=313589 RepID=UPI0000670D00|nr:acyl-CoA dehydrogenase family protein [Janibacter sp. HTCC2649]EAQ00607.1 putative acyl-CoA dehydrogenase family protein [Janibacter sp. HTCC2649]
MSGTNAGEREDLRRSLRDLLSALADAPARQAAIESEHGHDPELWRRLAELGALSLSLPETVGGAGFGAVEQSVVLEELGRTLAPTPFLGTVVLAGTALEASGDERAHEYLTGIAEGDTLAALALAEADGAWRTSGFATRAEDGPGGWRLSGAKSLVVDGAVADLLVVAAETPAGPTLFVITSDDGVTRQPLRTLDLTRRMASVTFDGTPGTVIGELGKAGEVLERVLDAVMVALAAEQVGSARACLEASVAYAKDRVQFGRQIGSFQAVKHRCADMFVRVQLAGAAAQEAAHAADGESGRGPADVAAAVAHSVCSEAAMMTATENIHVHGGIGFTWEHSAHLYFRRAKSSQLLLGGPGVGGERLLARLGT